MPQVSVAGSQLMSSLHLMVTHVLTMMLIVHLRPTPLDMLGPVVTMVKWLVSSHLAMVHVLMSPHLIVVIWLMTLHLIMMTTLIVCHSTHSAKLMVIMGLLRDHLSLHLPFLLSLQSFLLSLLVFFLLIIILVEHITDFSQMINFGVSSIKLVILISTLNHIVPSFFISHFLLFIVSGFFGVLFLSNWLLIIVFTFIIFFVFFWFILWFLFILIIFPLSNG